MKTENHPLARERSKSFSWWQRMKRVARYRLVIPIKRSTNSPEYTARGVAVGLGWALTPSIGIQMIFCFVTWIVAKRIFKWDFSVLIAMAWTWTTNVITAIPCFYVFFITGQLLLKGSNDLSGYDEFSRQWSNMIPQDSNLGYFEKLLTEMSIVFDVWGVPLLIGCLPWALLGSVSGYYLSLAFVRRHREARAQRRLEARKRVVEGH
jgi:uncharacterized protein (DUF2062 family)